MGKNSKALKLLSERKEIKKKRGLTPKEEAIEECTHTEETKYGDETLLKALGDGIFKCSLCKTKIDLNARSEKEVKDIVKEMLNMIQSLKVVNSKYMTRDSAEMFAEAQILIKKIGEMYIDDITNRDKDYGDDDDDDNSIFNENRNSMSISTRGIGFGFNDDYSFNKKNKKKKNKKKPKRADVYSLINNRNNY